MPKRSRRDQLGPLTRGFAARLRASREKRGWSKDQLARESGLTRQRVIHFEQGVQHPQLREIELIAKVLKTEVATLLGLEIGKPAASTHAVPSREILEGVARHLRDAADAISQFLRPTPSAVHLEEENLLRPQPASSSSTRWPWDKILPVANRLLLEKPMKSWKPIELAQALKASGLKLQSFRGLHFAIMPHLRNTRLITEKANGTFTAKVNDSSSTGPKKSSAKPPPKVPALVPVVPKSKKSKDAASIEELALAARSILDAAPARTWKAKEFVQAVRATGVKLKTWRGVHLYLVKQLKDIGAISSKPDGTFSASTNDEPKAAPRPEVAQDAAIVALAQEIQTLAPRLTEMTPRERVAQLAVWAGRARQMDEELTEKRIPSNSGLRNQVKQVLARLKKLRKSLGCGWVDALSFAWSTNWKIYVEYNRGVAISEPSSLSAEQKKIYFHDILKSILTVRQGYARDLDASALVIEATQVLDDTDPLLIEAKKKFGNHQDRRATESSPAAPFRRQGDAPQRIAAANRDAQENGIPRSVLKITRGKTLLIAGGRGSHDTQRLAVKKGLQFKAVDWITGERHPNPADLFSMAIRNKKYDIVLLMPGTDDAEPLVMACKEAGSRLMYLTRGPSIPSVAEAITGQQVVGGPVPELMETE